MHVVIIVYVSELSVSVFLLSGRGVILYKLIQNEVRAKCQFFILLCHSVIFYHFVLFSDVSTLRRID